MTEYKKYPEYKDSGVEWLGEIPSGWSRRNLGNLAEWINGFAFKPHDLDGSKYEVVRIKQMLNPQEKMDKTDLVIPDKYFLKNGDLIYSWSMTLATHIWDRGEALLNQHLYKVVANDTTTTYWLRYSLDAAHKELVNLMHGSAAKHITKKNLLSFQIPLPSIDTQKKIVSFLDTETKKIDDSVASMESLISLLTEKRTALISETVTRGIPGEHTEFKNSGVEWLREIPAGWSIEKIGSVFSEKREKVSDKDYPALSVTKKGIVPQLSNAAKTDDGDNRRKVTAGDFVINSRSDRKGSSGISAYTGSVSLISTVIRPSDKLNSNFIHHLLRSVEFQEEYYRYGRGIVADLWTTRYSDMKAIKIPVPSLSEQEKIVNYITRELPKIDNVIKATAKSISLLKEKRQTLISDAVTGKIDVRDIVD